MRGDGSTTRDSNLASFLPFWLRASWIPPRCSCSLSRLVLARSYLRVCPPPFEVRSVREGAKLFAFPLRNNDGDVPCDGYGRCLYCTCCLLSALYLHLSAPVQSHLKLFLRV